MKTNILSRLFYLFICLFSCLFTACQSSDDGEETIVTFSTETQNMFEEGVLFGSVGGEQTVSFTSNASWSVSIAKARGEDSWCVVSPLNGEAGNGSFKIVAKENTTDSDRTVVITFVSGTLKQDIMIKQSGKITKRIVSVACYWGDDSYTDQDLTTYEYDGKGQVVKIITSDGDYTYSYEDSKIVVIGDGDDVDFGTITYYLEQGTVVRSTFDNIERTYHYDEEQQLVKEVEGADYIAYTWKDGNVIKTQYFNDSKDVFNYTYTDKAYEFIGGEGSDDIFSFSLSESVLWNEGYFGKRIKNMIKDCDNGFYYKYEYNDDGFIRQVEELGDCPTKWVITYN